MFEPQHIRVGPADAPNRYELIERKAAGGEGEVWKAREFHGGQPFLYAVKIIDVVGADVADRRLEDLRMQAALATQLEHPALVKIKEVFVGAAPAGETGQRLYFVMKWIEGHSMQDALNLGALRGLDALDWLEPIADALDYLHAGSDTNGVPVLHRDIKPANIVRAKDGRTYLIDFGLLRMRSNNPTSRIFGTVPFMAPETLSRGEYSPATDRYALGASVYFAITGDAPMVGDHEAMAKRLAAELGAGGNRIAGGILAMLASQPDRRPQNAVRWIRGLRSAPPQTTQSVPTQSGTISAEPMATATGSPATVRLGGGPVVPRFPPRPPSAEPPSQIMPAATPRHAGYPRPPMSPPFGHPPANYPGVPANSPRKQHSAGLVTALIIGSIALLVGVVCCLPVYLVIQSGSGAPNGSDATPSRSIDRASPPPALTTIQRALVSVADIAAVMRVDQKSVTSRDDALTDLGGGLNRFALCSEQQVAGDAIGAHATNGFSVSADGAPKVSSAVAGFYRGYSAEFMAAARSHAERCGWRQFVVDPLGQESFGVFTQGNNGDAAAMVFVRTEQVVHLVVVRAANRGSYWAEAIKLAANMAARVPKAGS